MLRQQRPERWRNGAQVQVQRAVLIVECAGDTPDAVGMGVMTVVAHLTDDIERDEQATCQPDAQPDEIERGVEFVFAEVAEGTAEVVLNHGILFWEKEQEKGQRMRSTLFFLLPCFRIFSGYVQKIFRVAW